MTNPKNHTGQRVVMLADAQSFYASVEKAAHPELANQPLVVAGDPSRRSGIILAACPLAKARGVKTAELLGSALAKCPELTVVRPRMQTYIHVSRQMTKILESYTELVEPYSIDEQFVDVTGSLDLFGCDPATLARRIQEHILNETGVYTRFGISYCKVVSKMSCDNFAKKHPSGIDILMQDQLANRLWPLPVHKAFMIGYRMTTHLTRMGIHTIGELARYPLAQLRKRWGVNGEVLWQIANGKDDSPVRPETHDGQKGIGHQITLPRDYADPRDIELVLLELCDLVCRRCRDKRQMGQVIQIGCRGADFNQTSGFFRQMKMPVPSYFTDEIYPFIQQLFHRHWDGQPVRKVGVSVTELITDQAYQLDLFHNRVKKQSLARTTDAIKDRYGDTAVMRASSLTDAAQTKDRSNKIGGHYK